MRLNQRTVTALRDLGLNISPEHLRLSRDNQSLMVRIQKPGEIDISKTINVAQAGGLKEAFLLGEQYRKFYMDAKRHPSKTEKKMLDLGFDALYDHTYISNYKYEDRNKGVWRVRFGGKKDGTTGAVKFDKTFSYQLDDTEAEMEALRKAVIYKKEVAGQIDRLNSKVKAGRKRGIGKKYVPGSQTFSMVRDVQVKYDARKAKFKVSLVRPNNQGLKVIDYVDNEDQLKRAIRKSIRLHNDLTGGNRTTNLESVAQSLRHYYLQAKGIE